MPLIEEGGNLGKSKLKVAFNFDKLHQEQLPDRDAELTSWNTSAERQLHNSCGIEEFCAMPRLISQPKPQIWALLRANTRHTRCHVRPAFGCQSLEFDNE